MRNTVAARGVVSAIVLVLLGMVAMPSAALAHERRAVGSYTFVVGFNEEPAFQGQPNGVQLTVTNTDGPVEGLADALRVTVGYGGGQPKEFKLRSVFGQPGRYVADLIPTRPGTYIFNFTGTIFGTPVSERFESGPGRFSDIEAVDAIQFPETVPPGNEVARQARAADDRAASAEMAAQSAQSLAMVGVGVGVVGSLIGLVGIWMAFNRRSVDGTASRAR